MIKDHKTLAIQIGTAQKLAFKSSKKNKTVATIPHSLCAQRNRIPWMPISGGNFPISSSVSYSFAKVNNIFIHFRV